LRSIPPAFLWFLPVVGLAEPVEPSPAIPVTEFEIAWIRMDDDTGRARLVPVPRPEDPGEALHTVRFRYSAETNAAGLRIVAPIPEGRWYVAGSAFGPGAVLAFSVDGGRTFATAGELKVTGEPPDEVSRTAWPREYSHVRWDLPGRFPPGVSGLVSFRTRPAGAGQP
jgi:hypothetical protein